jgi:solute carrier family 29 (equilibrative nucleoside transporter), member 1/2/3
MEVDTRSTIIIFFINGINCLIGWNAVLAAFDFFADSFPTYNVYSFLPVPLFAAFLITGALFHIISNKFKYVQIIVVGNMTMFFSMIAILIVSIVLRETTVGYTLMLISDFFIGLGLSLSQLTFYAMINYLSQNVVSIFTVGTGVSFLLITCVRALITLIFGAE